MPLTVAKFSAVWPLSCRGSASRRDAAAARICVRMNPVISQRIQSKSSLVGTFIKYLAVEGGRPAVAICIDLWYARANISLFFLFFGLRRRHADPCTHLSHGGDLTLGCAALSAEASFQTIEFDRLSQPPTP